jgi:uncharacterized membrane protein YfcA
MDIFFELNYFFCAIAQLVSHIILGCTGFGGTVVAAPFTQQFLGVSVAVPFGNLVTFPVLIAILIKEFKKIDWKNLLIIVAVMCLGLPIGQSLFLSMDANIAKLCIGFIVTLVAILGLYKMFIKIPKLKSLGDDIQEKPDTLTGKIIRYLCLFIGGIVHGAFVIGGPLITVYTISAIKEKRRFRATMTMVWMIINTLNTINCYRTGQLVPEVWEALVLGIPFALVGYLIGNWLHNKVDQEKFMKIVYIVLAIVGFNMFIRALLTFI